MASIWIYTLLSVTAISLVSFVGAFFLGFRDEQLRKMLFFLVSFSAGALLGDVFIHILPEILGGDSTLANSVYILIGILAFFVLERLLLWHHAHDSHAEEVHTMVPLTIFGDALHNFLDGMAVAASFLVSIPVGVATATAVIFHEIPQEIGQFAILVHGGWSTKKALIYNFLSGLTAILGAIIVLIFAGSFAKAPAILLSFGAASFIYVALSDLVPELQKERNTKRSTLEFLCMLLGVAVMALLLFFD